MAYVVKENIIVSIDDLYTIAQGDSNTFSVKIHRDSLGNLIN